MAKPASTRTPPAPLPKSLVAALPTASEIVKHADAIAKLLPKLQREMASAKKRGAIDLARSFTVLHRLVDTLREKTSGVGQLFEHYKVVECPEVFEQAGISHVPLAEGFRVGVSFTTRASIVTEYKQQAYQWLRDYGNPDIITETVNASTLSALARTLMEEQNMELPEKLFRVANVPNTSVTKTG